MGIDSLSYDKKVALLTINFWEIFSRKLCILLFEIWKRVTFNVDFFFSFHSWLLN